MMHKNAKHVLLLIFAMFSGSCAALTGDPYGYYFEGGYFVATDNLGDVYVLGSFIGTVDFDPGNGVDVHTSNRSKGDTFLSKFDPSGKFIWARTWDGPDTQYDQLIALKISNFDNIYIAGEFNGTIDFDPGDKVEDHTSASHGDSYILKYDPDGKYLWARNWGPSTLSDIFPGNDDGILVKGDHWDSTVGAVDYDPSPNVSELQTNSSSSYFSKFDSAGNFLEVSSQTLQTQTTGTSWGGEGHIYRDKSSNIFITGEFGQTINLGSIATPDHHTSNGDWDIFLKKLDSTGKFLWGRTWGGTDMDYAKSITGDDPGNVYVMGSFYKTVDFDPGPGVNNFRSNGDIDVFISKFDTSGNYLWTITWGGSSCDDAGGMTLDKNGNILVTGGFCKQVDFDPGSGEEMRTANGPNDIYISKFDSNGKLVWVRTWGGSDWVPEEDPL